MQKANKCVEFEVAKILRARDEFKVPFDEVLTGLADVLVTAVEGVLQPGDQRAVNSSDGDVVAHVVQAKGYQVSDVVLVSEGQDWQHHCVAYSYLSGIKVTEKFAEDWCALRRLAKCYSAFLRFAPLWTH